MAANQFAKSISADWLAGLCQIKISRSGQGDFVKSSNDKTSSISLL